MNEEHEALKKDLEVHLDAQVNARFNHIDALLAELQHQLVTRWTVAIIGLLVAGIAIYYVAHKASTTATTAHNTVQSVAQVRRQTILQTCQDQNARNTKTIVALKQQGKMFEKKNPARAAEIAASINSSILLINDIVPHQNCQKLVQKEAPATH